MVYFEIINESLVREIDSAQIISTLGEPEGQTLSKTPSDSSKIVNFNFNYQIQEGEDVKFVFGSTEIRERFVEVPLSKDKNSLSIKVNLHKKTITGDVIRPIEANVRKIKWFGFVLKNSKIKISELQVKEPAKPQASKEAKKVEIKSPLVCLLTKDSEKEIAEKLKEIEKRFKKNYGLIIADAGSQDSTYEIIKAYDSKARFYHYFQFDQNISLIEAGVRLREFAKTQQVSFSSLIYEELTQKEDKHKIQSFCTVADYKVKIEASILIKSLREHHEQPIYVVCDSETKKFLKIEKVKNVCFKEVLDKKSLEETKKKLFSDKFSTINKYHKPECILHKMNAMNLALENHENTFFLDADVIVLANLQENFEKDIVLSPHFYNYEECESSLKYGFFNAGYIFCADKSFPDYWKNLYLNKSTFFEQEGLNYVVEDYDIQTFSRSHNFGFWRKDKPLREMKSFHVHTIEKEFGGEKTLQDANQCTKEIFFEYLRENNQRDLIKYIHSSEGKAWGGVDSNCHITVSNPNAKLDLGDQQIFWHHRSGWNYAIQALSPLHNENGVKFDGFLEKNFAWAYENNLSKNKLPYKEPWVGFFHNPPNIPDWFFYENSIQEIIKKPEVKESLENCIGLFALSEYHAEFLRSILNKPVSTLIHPSEIPEKIFSYESYLNNPLKKIVNIGYWLRKLNSIYLLPIKAEDGFTKIRLLPYDSKNPNEKITSLINTEKKIFNIDIPEKLNANTITLDRLDDKSYDTLLTQNLVFLDLYDSSANNAIIECLARATPILVNPLPAVVEYLGENYPFYFDNLNEAAEKAKDLNLIKETHEFMLNSEIRKKLSGDYFRRELEKSEVYKLL